MATTTVRLIFGIIYLFIYFFIPLMNADEMPLFEASPRTVLDGGNVSFTCTHATVDILVQFMFNGSGVYSYQIATSLNYTEGSWSGRKTHFTATDGDYIVTLMEFNINDTGIYYCRVYTFLSGELESEEIDISHQANCLLENPPTVSDRLPDTAHEIMNCTFCECDESPGFKITYGDAGGTHIDDNPYCQFSDGSDEECCTSTLSLTDASADWGNSSEVSCVATQPWGESEAATQSFAECKFVFDEPEIQDIGTLLECKTELSCNIIRPVFHWTFEGGPYTDYTAQCELCSDNEHLCCTSCLTTVGVGEDVVKCATVLPWGTPAESIEMRIRLNECFCSHSRFLWLCILLSIFVIFIIFFVCKMVFFIGIPKPCCKHNEEDAEGTCCKVKCYQWVPCECWGNKEEMCKAGDYCTCYIWKPCKSSNVKEDGGVAATKTDNDYAENPTYQAYPGHQGHNPKESTGKNNPDKEDTAPKQLVSPAETSAPIRNARCLGSDDGDVNDRAKGSHSVGERGIPAPDYENETSFQQEHYY